MNLLEGYKSQINQALTDIFDTFKRASLVTFHKVNDEEIIVMDPDYNADLQEYDAINSNLVEVSQQFECRIIFPKRDDSHSSSIPNLSVPIKADQDLTEIYLQVKPEGYEFLKNTVRFQFLGENYQKSSPIRPLGFLDTFTLYQINLKRVS